MGPRNYFWPWPSLRGYPHGRMLFWPEPLGQVTVGKSCSSSLCATFGRRRGSTVGPEPLGQATLFVQDSDYGRRLVNIPFVRGVKAWPSPRGPATAPSSRNIPQAGTLKPHVFVRLGRRGKGLAFPPGTCWDLWVRTRIPPPHGGISPRQGHLINRTVSRGLAVGAKAWPSPRGPASAPSSRTYYH